MKPEQFKALQAGLGYTNAGLAELLGCSLSTVTKYRNGSQPIPKDTRMALQLLASIRWALDNMNDPGNLVAIRKYLAAATLEIVS